MAPKHQKSLKKIAFEDIIWLPKFWDYICKFAYNLYYNTYEIRYWEPEKKGADSRILYVYMPIYFHLNQIHNNVN